MDFPIGELMDESACYEFLVGLLHPDGLACPHCGDRGQLEVHRRDPRPDPDLSLLRLSPHLQRLRRHDSPGDQAAADRAGPDPPRHRPRASPPPRWPASRAVAVPSCSRSAIASRSWPSRTSTGRHCKTRRSRPTRCPGTRGEKGVPHRDEEDPPRRRANKAVGHGTWDRDRPPVCGAVGRESGRARPHVEHRTDRATLERVVVGSIREGAMVYSDEWKGYHHLSELGRGHATVCHTVGEWARDDDGDGVREVHDNTLEGCGRGCGTTCGSSGASAKSTYANMWRFSSGPMT